MITLKKMSKEELSVDYMATQLKTVFKADMEKLTAYKNEEWTIYHYNVRSSVRICLLKNATEEVYPDVLQKDVNIYTAFVGNTIIEFSINE